MQSHMPKLIGRLTLAVLFVVLGHAAALAGEPLRPRVVIVAYFEDTPLNGEAPTARAWGGGPARPGELSRWVERLHLTRKIVVAGAFNAAWTNADGTILALKVGPNSLHPAVNLTALGLDPQLDLRRSYWLFNGIAGITPSAGTIGDAVWTDFVVNGDAAHEIDAREIPSDWSTGYIPPGKATPYATPRVLAGSADDVTTWGDSFRTSAARNVIGLNRALARWAYQTTQSEALADSQAMQAVRDRYAGFPAAQARPAVRMGATLSSETFWLGARLDQWARDWVAYLTDGRAAYVTTETNDAGSMVAIAALAKAGRADPDRVLLLRTASNFDMPPPGVTAAQNLADAGPGAYAAYDAALESAFAVGSKVVREILDGWARYGETPPAPR